MTLALHRGFETEAARPPAPSAQPRYGAGRPNLPLVGLVVALHVGALAVFVAYDVLPVIPKRPAPVLIELVADPPAPPPHAPPPPPAASPTIKLPATPSPMIAATPVLAAPAAAQVVVSPAPPMQTSVAPAAPAAAPAPPAPPAPIVPPDMNAATLGNPAPDYPIDSRRRREQGVVRLRVTIAPDGSVRAIEVARSSGFDRLDQAALAAVRRWHFRPGTQAGVPVEAVGTLAIPFRLT